MGFGSVCWDLALTAEVWHTVNPQQPFQDPDLLGGFLAQSISQHSRPPCRADPDGSHLEYSALPTGTSYQDAQYWSQPQGHVENTMAKPLITVAQPVHRPQGCPGPDSWPLEEE